MIAINTVVLSFLLLATSAFAEVSKPYGVFNPITMFDLSPRTRIQGSDSAFYNYGNKGYDFVVEAMPAPIAKASARYAVLAGLAQNSN